MSEASAPLAGRAAAMRETFDRSFAQPPAPEAARSEDFLAIRVAGDPHALRVAEIAGLFADQAVTPVPSAVPELLGVSVLRGAIVPVYDFAALLGRQARAAPRWLVLAGAREPVALAFEAMEARLVVASRDVIFENRDAGARPQVRGAVRAAGGPRPVVHLPSVLEDIDKRVAAIRSTREA